MKKTTIQITYDEERLSALQLFMQQKNLSMDEELLKAVDTLYNRYVPQSVREFFTLKNGEPAQQSAKTKEYLGASRRFKAFCNKTNTYPQDG